MGSQRRQEGKKKHRSQLWNSSRTSTLTVAGFEPAAFCGFHDCDADALPLRYTVHFLLSSPKGL